MIHWAWTIPVACWGWAFGLLTMGRMLTPSRRKGRAASRKVEALERWMEERRGEAGR